MYTLEIGTRATKFPLPVMMGALQARNKNKCKGSRALLIASPIQKIVFSEGMEISTRSSYMDLDGFLMWSVEPPETYPLERRATNAKFHQDSLQNSHQKPRLFVTNFYCD